MEPKEPSSKFIDATFAKALRDARIAAGLSQDALTESMNERGHSFAVTAISKIERGERKVTIGEASTLADILKVSLDSLLGGQANLQSRYADQTHERNEFVSRLHSYTLALLYVAVAADNANNLNERDIDWLNNELVRQTPAQMTTDAIHAFDAAVSRGALNTDGHYLRTLRSQIERDTDALRPEHEADNGQSQR